MIARSCLALALAALLAVLAASVDSGVATAGGGCHEPLTDAAGVRVNLKGACFLPSVLRINVGTTVTFTNRDATAHTVTGAGLRSSSGGWGSFDELRQDQPASYTFASSGVYPYYCLIHPSMVGAIVVGDGQLSLAAATSSGRGGATSPDAGASRASLGGGLPISVAVSMAGAIIGIAGAASILVRHRSRA